MSDEGTVGEAVDNRTASEFCGVKFSNQVPELLTGEETVCIWRQWVSGHEKREDAVARFHQRKRIHYKVNRRPSQSKYASARPQAQIRCLEREKSSVRAKVIVKHQPHIEACENRLQNSISCSR